MKPSPYPEINVKFEVVGNGITGTTYVDVKRVEMEDDGSYTVVVDHWCQKETPKEDINVKPRFGYSKNLMGGYSLWPYPTEEIITRLGLEPLYESPVPSDVADDE